MSTAMAPIFKTSTTSGKNYENAGTYSTILKMLLDSGVEDWAGRGLLNYAFKKVNFTDSDFAGSGLPEKFITILNNSCSLFIKNPESREKFKDAIIHLSPKNNGKRSNGVPNRLNVIVNQDYVAPPSTIHSNDSIKILINAEDDIVRARQTARMLAEKIGFTKTEQIKIATAVSELTRNIFKYSGQGYIAFDKLTDPKNGICIQAVDKGNGISNLDEILSGGYKSKTGMGLGILCCKRLMDYFHIVSNPQSGTSITIKKFVM